ncbi:hypothetical protein [Senegalia massiliensis]|uniref:Uncharacterized protein n=1 Tax=Senegalia massiliensis TaxID=1720316 RepID=A0A845R4P0_9CLOT|nr:hypothetical protein [Senegalia massiliensis]NBI08382.1 hypothetical protein [Senegalia massiliensis]
MISSLLISVNTQNNASIFNENWFNTVLGFFLSVLVYIITSYRNEKKSKKNEIKNLLIQISYNHHDFFTLIYIGAYNKEKIDYLNIRKNIKNMSFLYLLPTNLKMKFLDLYKIHNGSPEYYEENKDNIHGLLCDIVNILNKYGDETFGYK